jgi:hypothetical protein
MIGYCCGSSSKRRTTITLLTVLLLTATDILFFCAAQSNNNTTSNNNNNTTPSSSSYEVSIDGIFINDVITQTDDIAAIHTNKQFDIVAKLVWSSDYYDINSNNEILWTMYVNEVQQDSSVLPLVEVRAIIICVCGMQISCFYIFVHCNIKMTLLFPTPAPVFNLSFILTPPSSTCK